MWAGVVPGEEAGSGSGWAVDAAAGSAYPSMDGSSWREGGGEKKKKKDGRVEDEEEADFKVCRLPQRLQPISY